MMEAPLTTSPSFDEVEAPTGPVQPLPQELRDQVRLLLLQPRRGAVAPGESAGWQQLARLGSLARLAVCPFLWSMAYPVFRAFKLAGVAEAGIVFTSLCVVAGAILGVFSVPSMFREAIPHALAQLEAPVGPKAPDAVAKLLKGGKACLVYLLTILVGMSVVVLVESEPETALQWASSLTAVALSVPTALAVTAWVVGQVLICLLAEDKVRQLVAEIQRVTAATADYTMLANGVYRAHTDTARLSVLIQRQLLGGTVTQFANTLTWFCLALGPRPSHGPDWGGFGSWYNVFVNEYFCVLMSTICAAMGVFVLVAPAKVTSACQQVADAVNDLRVTAKADGTVELATAEELHLIEGLKRYINELNRDQGLGFVLLHKKITFTFVMGLLIQTMSAIIVVNTTLMSLLKVGNTQQAVLSESSYHVHGRRF